ncbi:MAG: cation transporting ATPase C-terminal domain-containing protein [Acidithiobacillus ferrivorans]
MTGLTRATAAQRLAEEGPNLLPGSTPKTLLAKAADVGIAMGERGTDVAREASALVLLPALLNWPILLLPVHIAVLELLIDPACSTVFEAEPAAADILCRPPRPRDANPFAVGDIGFALAQGLGIAIILLTGCALLQNLGWTEENLRISVFTGLVLALLLLILSNRDLAHTALRNLGGNNPLLAPMFAGVGVVLVATLTIPFVRNVMGFAAISMPPLLVAGGLLLACILWLQIVRSVLPIILI